MNCYKIFAAAVVVAALAVPSAMAAGSQTLTADIPFEFVVAGKAMPAGQYEVGSGPVTGAVMLTSADWKYALNVLSNPAQSNAVNEKAKLVFHRYGDKYFLSQVWFRGGNLGRQLNKTKLEREMIRAAAAPAEQVVLAMR